MNNIYKIIAYIWVAMSFLLTTEIGLIIFLAELPIYFAYHYARKKNLLRLAHIAHILLIALACLPSLILIGIYTGVLTA